MVKITDGQLQWKAGCHLAKQDTEIVFLLEMKTKLIMYDQHYNIHSQDTHQLQSNSQRKPLSLKACRMKAEPRPEAQAPHPG